MIRPIEELLSEARKAIIEDWMSKNPDKDYAIIIVVTKNKVSWKITENKEM